MNRIATMLSLLTAVFRHYLNASAKSMYRRQLSVEFLEERVTPTLLMWIAPNAGNWNANANWVDAAGNNVAPRNGDIVLFGGSLAGKTGTNTQATNNIPNLNITELVIAGSYTSIITLAQPLTVGGQQTGAQVSGTMYNGNVVGTLTIGAGTFNWSAGTFGNLGIEMDLIVSAGATLDIQQAASVVDGTINNSGTVVQNEGGNLVLGGASTINNQAGGQWTIPGAQGITAAGALGGDFNNSGKVSVLSGQPVIGVAFTNNAGTARLTIGGSIWFQASVGQSNGITTMSPGATIQVSDTFEVSGGSLRVQATGMIIGNLTITGNAAFRLGTPTAPASMTVTNNYTQIGGTLYIGVTNSPTDPLSWSTLAVGNTVVLGSTLNVNTIGASPTMPLPIITGSRRNPAANFAAFVWVGITYTTDLTNPAIYFLVPAIIKVTSVVPPVGPVAGGTVVTIAGVGFTAASVVDFGSVSATSFTVNSDTQITATDPAQPVGPVNVTVTSPLGTSAITPADVL